MTRPEHKPLQLDVQRRGEATVVTIIGSVSISEAERLRVQLEAIAAEEAPLIVLDLGEMDFICSLGLGAIISGHLKCRRHHGQIRLARPTSEVMELLETTRLTKLFGVYQAVEQALSDK